MVIAAPYFQHQIKAIANRAILSVANLGVTRKLPVPVRFVWGRNLAGSLYRRHPPQYLRDRIALHVLIEQCLLLLLGDDA